MKCNLKYWKKCWLFIFKWVLSFILFLVACYATLYVTMSVGLLVCRSVGPSVRRSRFCKNPLIEMLKAHRVALQGLFQSSKKLQHWLESWYSKIWYSKMPYQKQFSSIFGLGTHRNRNILLKFYIDQLQVGKWCHVKLPDSVSSESMEKYSEML